MLGVNRDTVRNDLAVVRTQWLKNAERKLDERKSEELARLDAIEAVAWRQFRKSCQARQKTRKQVTKGRSNKAGLALPDLTREETRTEESAGDPRYLERISWCVSKRCELLGLGEGGSTVTTAVTVIGGVDLDVIIGKKKLPRQDAIINHQPAPFGMELPPIGEDKHASPQASEGQLPDAAARPEEAAGTQATGQEAAELAEDMGEAPGEVNNDA
jgi:hypothetical protein